MEEIGRIMWIILIFSMSTLILIGAINKLVKINIKLSMDNLVGIVFGILYHILTATIVGVWLWFLVLTNEQIEHERKNSNMGNNTSIDSNYSNHKGLSKTDTTAK